MRWLTDSLAVVGYAFIHRSEPIEFLTSISPPLTDRYEVVLARLLQQLTFIYLPMKLTADRTAGETWLYPLNRPKREYQFNIVRECLSDNTLAALPTGLGKTFIAGSVMLNCASPILQKYFELIPPLSVYRWFPSGKVIFVAPSKPLVAQQIQACHQTRGIPGSDAVELTGEVSSAKRSEAVSLSRLILPVGFTFVRVQWGRNASSI